MTQTDKEYAEALFTLSLECDKTEEFAGALDSLRRLITENPDYTDFLSSPAIPLCERIAAIDEAFAQSMPEYVVSFLKLLCEHGRTSTLCGCIDEFFALYMAGKNRAAAKIVSALPLSEEQKTALCNKLKKMTGKEIDPEYTVDGSLLGGMRIELDGKSYDGTLRSRLQDVKDVIIG